MTYEKGTMVALRQSAEKWTAYANGENVDVGSPSECPLCILFYSERYDDSCRGCPIAEKTGDVRCDGSPYQEWSREGQSYNWHIEQPFAKKEAEFLWQLYFELGGEK